MPPSTVHAHVTPLLHNTAPPHGHAHQPRFDVDDAFRQLTAFCDSTIVFFKRRADLEQQYVEGLEKLIAKQDEIDRRQPAASALLFNRWDSGMQLAWLQVRAIAYAELSEKRLLIDSLKKSVIDPLIAFRDQKERQRRRIADESRTVAAEHAEYKAQTLRLQRTYVRRSEDAAQHSKEHHDALPHNVLANLEPRTPAASIALTSAKPPTSTLTSVCMPVNDEAFSTDQIAAEKAQHVQDSEREASQANLTVSTVIRKSRSSSSIAPGVTGRTSEAVVSTDVTSVVGPSISHVASRGQGHSSNTASNEGNLYNAPIISGATSSSLRDAQLALRERDRDREGVNNIALAIRASRQQLNSMIARLGKSRSTTATSSQREKGQERRSLRATSPAPQGRNKAPKGPDSSNTSPTEPSAGPAWSRSDEAGEAQHADVSASYRSERDGFGDRDREGREKSNRSTLVHSSATLAQLQQKMSKAKREAEEADANYRAAIHHLETLRLQRERVSKAGLGSLGECAYELGEVCKGAFTQYSDSMATRAKRSLQSSDRARQAALLVESSIDSQRFIEAANLVAYSEASLPYENYHVGTSYSLIFGVSLNEYTAANDGVLVPLTVQRAILEIDSRGLDAEGIYRVPGKLGLIQHIVQEIEQDEIMFEFDQDKHDVHTVAGVMKLYLRQLPDALLPMNLAFREAITAAAPEDARKMLKKRLRRMSPSHQATAKMLIAHFARVLARTERNKMNSTALCLCLTPVVFPEDTSALLAASSNNGKDGCLAMLINQRQDLFNGLPLLDETSNAYRSLRPSSMINLDDDDGDPAWRNSQDDLRFTHPLSAVPAIDGLAASSVQHRAGSPWNLNDAEIYRKHHGRSTEYSSDFDGQHDNITTSHPDRAALQYSASEASYISPPISRSGSLLPPISPGQDETAGAPSCETSEPLSTGAIVDLQAMSPPTTESHSPSIPGSGTASPHRSFSQRARSGSQTIANAVRSTLTGRTRSPAQTPAAFVGPTHGAWQQSGPLSPPLAQPRTQPLVSPLRETVSPYTEEELAAACIADTQRSSPWSPPRPSSRLSSEGGRSTTHMVATGYLPSHSALVSDLPLGAVRISSRPSSRGVG